MGARISGGGSNVIDVEGVHQLDGVDFTIIPDRIEAGTYLLAGVATGGDVEVIGAPANHLDSLITGPSGHPFLRESERRFKERFEALRRELYGPAVAAE